MFYINVLCVAVICVCFCDIFQVWDNITAEIMYWITKGKIRKPFQIKVFQCSLCLSHHINVIIMFLMSCVSLPNYLYIVILSFFTPIIKNILLTVEEKIINLLNKL